VQGHVDAVRTERERRPEGDRSVRVVIAASPELLRYVALKGSIAVDGVSLTVADRDDRAGSDWFAVAVIPHTLAVTTLGVRGPGDPVNLEADVVAKYVERLLPVPDERGHPAESES
jgi:riboflavin synthase